LGWRERLLQGVRDIDPGVLGNGERNGGPVGGATAFGERRQPPVVQQRADGHGHLRKFFCAFCFDLFCFDFNLFCLECFVLICYV
jgi:hypothetical protein